MNVLVQGAVHALGYVEDGKYHREPDCYETIRDIIRYLRDDTDDYSARIECGKHNLIEHDLIPLIKSDDVPDEIFDISIRLFVNLCQPAIASMRGRAPADREQWKAYWDLEENLRRAKKAFADVALFVELKKRLELYFLETDYEDRDDRLRLIVERIVLLIRYIFSINSGPSEIKRTKAEANSHDQVIIAFLCSGIDKTLMHIANMPREKEFHVNIMDIFALLLKEQKVEDIVNSTDEKLNEADRQKAEEDFRKINEIHAAKEAMKRNSFTRFGGSYVVKGMKASGSKSDLVVFKPIRSIADLTFCDDRKQKKRVARNRRPFETEQRSHESSVEVRQKLRGMMICMVDTCANRLLKSAKQIVFEQKHALQRSSQINYFFLLRFVLRFTRMERIPLDRISNVTGIEGFHENNVRLLEYVESATTVKGVEAKSFGLKAQYALSAFTEMILLHQHAAEKGNESDKEMAQRALDHILKIEEYRELTVSIIKKYSPSIFSKSFLRELVLVNHYYMKLLEKSVKSGMLKSVTRKSKIKKTRKTNKTAIMDQDTRVEFDKMAQEMLIKLWEENAENVEKVLKGEIGEIEDMNPLNLYVDVEDSVQQQFAMLSIQRSLRSKCFPAAVGLYHAARKVWISEGIFGSMEMRIEEELEELRQICLTDLGEVAKKLKGAEEEAQKKLGGEEESEGEEEEEIDAWKIEEVQFEMDNYVGKYSKVEVLKWYVFLLNDFATNSAEINKALVKLLHRICFDIKMITRLYQISLFQVFTKINEHFKHLSKDARKMSPLYELYTFGYHFLKKFFAKFEEFGPNMAMEVLFWKGGKEVYEIDNGYGSYDNQRIGDMRVWTEELEEEVKHLYDEYNSAESNSNGIDVLDFIVHNLSRERTKKQVAKKLKEFGKDLMGAKYTIVCDSMIPSNDIRPIYEEWLKLENKEKIDVVEIIRERVGGLSRKRVIKNLEYLKLDYSKPKKEKSLPKWDEGLINELEELKQQYEEIEDAENIFGVDIVRYVMKRLSEKKPGRQIERYLQSMGANIKERGKKERSKKEQSKDDEFLNDESEEEREKSEEEREEENIVESDEEEKKEKLPDEAPKKNSLLERIRNRKRRFAQLIDSDKDSDSEDEGKEKNALEQAIEKHMEDVEIFNRKAFVNDLLTTGTVASMELAEMSSDPFTAPLKHKRRIVICDDEDD